MGEKERKKKECKVPHPNKCKTESIHCNDCCLVTVELNKVLSMIFFIVVEPQRTAQKRRI